MIFDALLSLLVGLLTFVLGLLPAFSAPDLSSVSDGLNKLGLAVHALDGWVDMSVLVVCLNAILAGLGAWVVVKGVMWLYEHVPFKSS